MSSMVALVINLEDTGATINLAMEANSTIADLQWRLKHILGYEGEGTLLFGDGIVDKTTAIHEYKERRLTLLRPGRISPRAQFTKIVRSLEGQQLEDVQQVIVPPDFHFIVAVLLGFVTTVSASLVAAFGVVVYYNPDATVAGTAVAEIVTWLTLATVVEIICIAANSLYKRVKKMRRGPPPAPQPGAHPGGAPSPPVLPLGPPLGSPPVPPPANPTQTTSGAKAQEQGAWADAWTGRSSSKSKSQQRVSPSRPKSEPKADPYGPEFLQDVSDSFNDKP